MLLIIIWYFFIIIFGLGLGLNLQKLASASASRFWPRLTSLAVPNKFSYLLIVNWWVTRFQSVRIQCF